MCHSPLATTSPAANKSPRPPRLYRRSAEDYTLSGGGRPGMWSGSSSVRMRWSRAPDLPSFEWCTMIRRSLIRCSQDISILAAND